MKLSIITINYNNRDGLQKTINSVISQTYKDFEWIVIDGGSTDGSKELIEQYTQYITYWVSEPDKGIYNAMNKGIQVAKGKYLHFLNSGDFYYDKEVLEDVFSSEHSEAVLYGNNANYIEGLHISDTIYPQELTLFYFFKGTISHQAAFILHSTFREMSYDEKRTICADSKHFIYILINGGKFEYLNRFVVKVDNGGCSRNPKFLSTMLKEKRQNLEDFIPSAILLDYQKYKELEICSQNALVVLASNVFETNKYFRFILKCFMKILIWLDRLVKLGQHTYF